jgi:hypothetical protein
MEVELIISPSGATATCPACGTQYDNWAVDESDYCPQVGDGCEVCDPDSEEEDM